MKIFILLFVLFLMKISFAQVIPENRRVDWSVAGYHGEIPEPELQVNVLDHGAVGDTVTDNYNAVISAINALNGKMGIVYFPPGGYLINSTINLPDSVIIKGATADSTLIVFDLGNQAANCFSITKGQSNNFVSVNSGYEKGSYEITLSNAGDFNAGDYAELREENGSWDTEPISWADYSVGQIVKIIQKQGNMLTLRNPLRIDYEESLNPEIQKIEPRHHVGIECLKMKRLDEPQDGVGYNIYFNYAAQCWVIGVESAYSVGSHFYISKSSNIDINGCYIHDAFKYDGSGTRGYGILIHNHSGECRVENNILRHLRHAMIIKTGANGNVFAYNYSLEPYRSEPIHDFSGDVSLHGHYAFSNLFEGNIIQNIIIDHYWGPSGPFNTFFRNRAELYGVFMTTPDTTQTNRQNFAGLEVTNTEPFYGLYTLTGSDHFQYGNNIKGTIIPSGTDDLDDDSYYLDGEPEFWNIPDQWPSIGIPNQLGDGSIPAYNRYLMGPLTVCRDTGTHTQVPFFSSNEKDFKIWPNPVSDVIHLDTPGYAKKVQITLYNSLGELCFEQQVAIPANITLPAETPEGLYFLRIFTQDSLVVKKIIKE